MKKTLIAILMFVVLTLGAGCQKPFENVETFKYEHLTGYEITLPAAWQKMQEDQSAAYFLSEDGGISINIITELGGFSFYSMDDLGQLLLEKLRSEIPDLKRDPVRSASSGKKQYRQVLSGTLPDGDEVFLDVFIYAPMNSVRYYVILSAGKDDFSQNSKLFSDIIKSFKLNKTEDEIYSLLNVS